VICKKCLYMLEVLTFVDEYIIVKYKALRRFTCVFSILIHYVTCAHIRTTKLVELKKQNLFTIEL